MWTLTDFRRKLLRFDRPLRPCYIKPTVPRYYSNFCDWTKTYFQDEKLANSCVQPIYHIKYPVLYEEHPDGDCSAMHTDLPVPLGNTRFLLLLMLLGITFVLFASSAARRR